MQTKAKVLNAIAEEHNIKWDSKSFEEKELKPAEDLLVCKNCLIRVSFVLIHWSLWSVGGVEIISGLHFCDDLIYNIYNTHTQ